MQHTLGCRDRMLAPHHTSRECESCLWPLLSVLSAAWSQGLSCSPCRSCTARRSSRPSSQPWEGLRTPSTLTPSLLQGHPQVCVSSSRLGWSRLPPESLFKGCSLREEPSVPLVFLSSLSRKGSVVANPHHSSCGIHFRSNRVLWTPLS